MKKKYLYKHGFPFSQDLDLDIQDQVDRINSNKASMILIDGGVGQGKTTIATEVADRIQGSPIDLETQLALGGGDFIKKLKRCFKEDKRVIIYDEAGDFSSRGALTKFNHMLNRVFETYRTFKIIVILVLPSFSDLDKSLFKKQIPRFLIHCEERNNFYGNYKVYSLWHMWYLLHKMKKLVVQTDAFRFTEPCKHGHFLDLFPERSKELDRISTKNKTDILGHAEIQIEGLLSYSDLAKRLGRSIVWLRKAVSECKIKAKKKWKNKKYFDDNALNQLSEVVEFQNMNMGVSNVNIRGKQEKQKT